MFKWIAAIAVAVLLGLATFSRAQAANEDVVQVTLKDFTVTLDSATFPTGTPIRFEVTNHGLIQHEFVLEKAGHVDDSLKVDAGGKETAADTEAIDPGQSKTLVWTFTEAGAYQAACHIKGHYEAGMVTKFTVVPPDQMPTGGPLSATTLTLAGLVGGLVLVGGFGAWRFAKR